jgi:NYN domain
MSRAGLHVYSRPLRYRNKIGPGGVPVLVGEEKGIDVRIAIDVLSCVIRGDCDVAVIFSQDQDLSEVADEVRVLAKEKNRWIKIASAFPVSAASPNHRGIQKTDWVKIDRQTYDSCVDPWDYRQGVASAAAGPGP